MAESRRSSGSAQNRLAAIFICSLCTSFDMTLSILWTTSSVDNLKGRPITELLLIYRNEEISRPRRTREDVARLLLKRSLDRAPWPQIRMRSQLDNFSSQKKNHMRRGVPLQMQLRSKPIEPRQCDVRKKQSDVLPQLHDNRLRRANVAEQLLLLPLPITPFVKVSGAVTAAHIICLEPL